MFCGGSGAGDVVFEAVVSAVDELCGEDRSGWSAAARAARVRELAALVERLQAEVIRAVDELDRDQGWRADSAVSAHGWLTAHTPLTRADASDLVRVARFRRRFPTTGAALADGELTATRLRLLARRVTPERASLYERDETMLLGMATAMGRTDDVRVVMARWAALADDELAVAKADAGHRRRRLSLSRGMDDQGFLDGELTPDGYAVVKAALDALDRPDPADIDGGPRTPAQRRADSLVDLCRHSLAEHTATTGPATAVQVIVDADLLGLVDKNEPNDAGEPADAAADADQPIDPDESVDPDEPVDADQPVDAGEPVDTHASDTAPDTIRPSTNRLDPPADVPPPRRRRPFDPSTARCEMLDPDPIPIGIETARRLLCDSYISRAVLRGRSEVLDLGRATRLFTTSQRRAIILRDHGCIAHGCDRGPRWCQIHHLRPWEHGGRTDLANGVLLCARHHHLVHEGGWRISLRTDGTPHLTDQPEPAD